jgi:hypothetical protein
MVIDIGLSMSRPRRPINAYTCMTQSGGGGRGGTGKIPRTLQVCQAHHISWHWIFSFKWVDGNVRARLSQWKGGQSGIPPATMSGQNTARDHRPHIFCLRITWGLSTSVHVGRMEFMRARPRQRVEMNTPTHAKCTPHYNTPIFYMRLSINRPYLLTMLSASQPETWHTYFIS